MWLLLLMIAIMPYEQSPYLLLGENLFGIFVGFTVIKALGLLGAGWAALRIAGGDAMTYRLGARQATIFFLFLLAVAMLSVLHGTGFQYVAGRYLAYAAFLPFLIVAVRKQEDLGRVLKSANGWASACTRPTTWPPSWSCWCRSPSPSPRCSGYRATAGSGSARV